MKFHDKEHDKEQADGCSPTPAAAGGGRLSAINRNPRGKWTSRIGGVRRVENSVSNGFSLVHSGAWSLSQRTAPGSYYKQDTL